MIGELLRMVWLMVDDIWWVDRLVIWLVMVSSMVNSDLLSILLHDMVHRLVNGRLMIWLIIFVDSMIFDEQLVNVVY